jgi:hypothetical protein
MLDTFPSVSILIDLQVGRAISKLLAITDCAGGPADRRKLHQLNCAQDGGGAPLSLHQNHASWSRGDSRISDSSKRASPRWPWAQASVWAGPSARIIAVPYDDKARGSDLRTRSLLSEHRLHPLALRSEQDVKQLLSVAIFKCRSAGERPDSGPIACGGLPRAALWPAVEAKATVQAPEGPPCDQRDKQVEPTVAGPLHICESAARALHKQDVLGDISGRAGPSVSPPKRSEAKLKVGRQLTWQNRLKL